MTILQEYNAALIKCDVNKCIEIEENNGLFGYPPEIVSIGLQAIDKGFDAQDAINEFTLMP